MTTDRALAPIHRARRALAEAKTVQEVKAVHDDIAGALRWAKQRIGLSFEAASEGEELLLRAIRQGGEMLAKMSLPGGDRKSRSRDVTLNLADLGISKMQSSRWQAAARVPEEAFEAWVQETREAEKQLTGAALIKLGRQQPATTPKRRRKKSIDGTTDDLQTVIDAGQEFSCIYADPPWRYGNQGTRASTNNHYQAMSVEEICNEPVAELVADNAHLHLWTTNAFLFDAREVIEAWGFEYKSCLVWVKPQMGIGNYWRVSHEFLLFGLRGNLPFADRGRMSWIEADRTKHSRKPRAVREAIEAVSPGPYLEMYGRERIDGWTVYGNQIEQRLFA